MSVGGELFKIELGDIPAGAASSAPPTPPAPKVEAPPPKAAPVAASPPPKPAAAAPKPAAAPAPKPAKAAPSAPVDFDGDNFPGYTLGSRTERAVSNFLKF